MKKLKKILKLEKNKQGGFTLIELIACLGVFAVVTGIILYNYAQFNSNVLITNYAYGAALTIRQAQVYGVSVRERGVGTGIFSSSYGIHISDDEPNNSFLFFADETDANLNLYNVGEELETHSLPGSYKFSNFCAISGVTEICSSNGAITYLDISFTRPEPDAHIRTSASPDTDIYNKATICIRSPLGKVRQVVVEQTGQISVNANPTSSCQ